MPKRLIKGQAMSEFLIVMALLLAIGGYLAYTMMGQKNSVGAIPVAEDNATTQIANDTNTH